VLSGVKGVKPTPLRTTLSRGLAAFASQLILPRAGEFEIVVVVFPQEVFVNFVNLPEQKANGVEWGDVRREGRKGGGEESWRGWELAVASKLNRARLWRCCLP
jgi:hypothetical protein